MYSTCIWGVRCNIIKLLTRKCTSLQRRVTLVWNECAYVKTDLYCMQNLLYTWICFEDNILYSYIMMYGYSNIIWIWMSICKVGFILYRKPTANTLHYTGRQNWATYIQIYSIQLLMIAKHGNTLQHIAALCSTLKLHVKQCLRDTHWSSTWYTSTCLCDTETSNPVGISSNGCCHGAKGMRILFEVIKVIITMREI